MMQRRAFLDANVLFSAAWTPGNGLLALWTKDDVLLYSSHYAAEEAERNLSDTDKRHRLARLLESVTLVGPLLSEYMPAQGKDLPEKDRPILLAAMAAQANTLLTGDRTHFGRWYGKTISGILVQRPSDFLQEKAEG